MGQGKINLNPTTFLSPNEDRKCEKLWTLPYTRRDRIAAPKEDQMANCSITVITPLVKNSVARGALPVTCKLDAPPAGVSIAEAEFFDATGKVTGLAVTTGQSFVLPGALPIGTGKLYIRVIGKFPANAYLDVIEDCPAATEILCITDNIAKYGFSYLEVL